MANYMYFRNRHLEWPCRFYDIGFLKLPSWLEDTRGKVMRATENSQQEETKTWQRHKDALRAVKPSSLGQEWAHLIHETFLGQLSGIHTLFPCYLYDSTVSVYRHSSGCKVWHFPCLFNCSLAGCKAGALQTLTPLCQGASLQSPANPSTNCLGQRSAGSPSLQPWEQSSHMFTSTATAEASLTSGENPRGCSFVCVVLILAYCFANFICKKCIALLLLFSHFYLQHHSSNQCHSNMNKSWLAYGKLSW